jgi:hypothetical protein
VALQVSRPNLSPKAEIGPLTQRDEISPCWARGQEKPNSFAGFLILLLSRSQRFGHGIRILLYNL